MSRPLTASTLFDTQARPVRGNEFRLPFPDYPCNARSFVHLDVYLKDVLTRLPTQRASEIGQLLPHQWVPA